jgi:hypothetical protein
VPVELPFFRDAPELTDFRIVNLSPGFALEVSENDAPRRLELFTNDPCIDNTARTSEVWTKYQGQIVHSSQPKLQPGCAADRVVPLFARWIQMRDEDHVVKEGVVKVNLQDVGRSH